MIQPLPNILLTHHCLSIMRRKEIGAKSRDCHVCCLWHMNFPPTHLQRISDQFAKYGCTLPRLSSLASCSLPVGELSNHETLPLSSTPVCSPLGDGNMSGAAGSRERPVAICAFCTFSACSSRFFIMSKILVTGMLMCSKPNPFRFSCFPTDASTQSLA